MVRPRLVALKFEYTILKQIVPNRSENRAADDFAVFEQAGGEIEEDPVDFEED